MSFRAGLLAMFVLTQIANGIVPTGSGVDSSWNRSHVDLVLVDFASGRVVPGWIRFKNLLWSWHLLHAQCTQNKIVHIQNICILVYTNIVNTKFQVRSNGAVLPMRYLVEG